MPVSSMGFHNAGLLFIQIQMTKQLFDFKNKLGLVPNFSNALLLPAVHFLDIYKHLLMGHAKLYKLFDASKHNLRAVVIRIHFYILKQIRAFQDWIWSAGANRRVYPILIAIITNIWFNWSGSVSSYYWESFFCRPTVMQTVSVKLL